MTRHWPLLAPAIALAVWGASAAVGLGSAMAVLAGVALFAAVLAAVHHAEVVAAAVGEPFGTLILALAVTVIEAALIVSVMLAGGAEAATLPRDTIFAAVMIIVNGAVGLCLVVGGIEHHEQSFRLDGATSALAALIALSTLSLVLPTFTTSGAGSTYSTAQLAFAGIASLALWMVFVFVQTVRHRDYFLPEDTAESEHAPPPPVREAWTSFGLLLVCLVVVVGLAKALSPLIESAVEAAGAPRAVIGIAIALLVLLPETWAAARAARANRLQTSLNLALGSALATIGLTIPVVALASVWLGLPLVLGLGSKELVLLALSFAVATITLGIGRTNVLQGAVHLVIFAAFVFLALVP